MKKEEEFLKRYEALSEVEQELLQIITLSQEPFNKTTLKKCATKALIFEGLKDKEKGDIIRNFVDNNCKVVSSYRVFTGDENAFLSKYDKDPKLSLNRDYYLYLIRNYCIKNPALLIYMEAIRSLFDIESQEWQDRDKIEGRIKREFYYSFFTNNEDNILKYHKKYSVETTKHRADGLLSSFLISNDTFNTELADKIPNKLVVDMVAACSSSRIYIKLILEQIDYLEKRKELKSQKIISGLYERLAKYYLDNGNIEIVKNILKKQKLSPDFYSPTIEFIRGNITKAYELYLVALEKELGKSKKGYWHKGIIGEYFALTLLAMGESAEALLKRTISAGVKEGMKLAKLLKIYNLSLQGNESEVQSLLFSEDIDSTKIIHLTILFFTEPKSIDAKHIKNIAKQVKICLKEENEWIAYSYYCLLKANKKTSLVSKDEKAKLDSLSKKYFDITTIVKQEEPWKKAFTKLKSISKKTSKVANSATGSTRLVWFAEIEDNSFYDLSPKEQSLGKTGKWTKGRPVALKRLKNNGLDCMLDIDRKIATCIKEEQYRTYGYYYDTEWVLDIEAAVPFIIEHPYIYLNDSKTTKLELVKDDIKLIVKETPKGYAVSLSEKIDKKGIQLIRETPSKYKVIETTETHLNISNILTKKGITIPKSEKKELKTLISDLSPILPIHSDIKAVSADGEKIKNIKSDATPHIHLLPVEDGIRAELFVKPFKTGGSFFKPSQGGKNVIAEIKGKQVQADRNLKKEKKLANAVIERCPSLAMRGKFNDIFEFDTSYEALDALLELQEIKKDIKILWPEGESLKILKEYDLSALNISVKNSNNWFELSGTIQIDETRIITLQQLLSKPANSKFIELDNGEFIALTEQLKQKIEGLAGFAFSDNEKTKIHNINANFADELLSDMKGFKSNKKWKEQVKKAANAINLSPALPTTMQAELRPYQLDGFNWLSRLSHWGVGACLADDMGLGKTIQALAIILERAKNGPQLVIAPASVCLNWIAESAKFAPTLNTSFFGTGDRKENLKNLKPFDLVLCTYGLLMSEEKNISKINWTTTVLDEAQSIKNFKAKRTQAAFNLQSDFRLITTGTPVENHLSELWTLFTFLNPGFLGTQSEFAAKFAKPIEQDDDLSAKKALKKMIKPFILRRLKTEVLEDLPEKTEINLSIEMSEEELAFYEALRRNSVDNIENLKEEKGAGAIHLQILAELTKLRRACCHSSLVSKDVNIESSKLQNFIRIVEDLKENKHKALVFSQFTGHLDIIRKVCDERKISYQYLDGSTPTKKRQDLVDKFQAGEGDIFLISLKAGGTGLNLTAADFVIHMDPWWNPAVEDQASDRAHRIGQQRPVTVYRFVTKNTVEERIIALHKKKRALADSLLDGTDVTGKMSAEDLLDLLK